MKYFKTGFLVSLAALVKLAVAATPAYALGMDFGVLQSQDKWKVGTVRAQESGGYCAMAGSFDRDIILAFSRNGENEDSLAIDFRNEFLKEGQDYGATVRAETGPEETLEAHASTNHSIVVTLPSQSLLLTALNTGARLWVTLDDVKVAFSLRDFESSYALLRSCAGKLDGGPRTSAVPVSPVEKTALNATPLASQGQNQDRALAESQQKLNISESRISALQNELQTAAQEKSDLTQRAEKGWQQSQLLQSTLDEKESALKAAMQEKSDLAQRIEAGERQAKLLQVALDAKEGELKAALAKGPVQEAALASVRAELVNLKKDHAKEIGSLKEDLLQKTQQLAARATEMAAVASELSVVKAERDMLRTRLETVSAALGMPPPVFPSVAPPAPLSTPAPTAEPAKRPKKSEINDNLVYAPERVTAAPAPEIEPPLPLTAAEPLPDSVPLLFATPATQKKKTAERKRAQQKKEEMPSEEAVVVKEEVEKKEDVKAEVASLLTRLTAIVTSAGEKADHIDTRTAMHRSSAVTLESLLDKSGLPISDFVDIERSEDVAMSRWNIGFVRGTYEQLAAEKDFGAQVTEFIESYRRDCGGAAEAQATPPQSERTGTISTAEVTCASISRPYVASILFLRNGSGFSAITHAAHPAQKAAAVDARDKILDALHASRGFVAPQKIAAVTPISSDDYDTVVIK